MKFKDLQFRYDVVKKQAVVFFPNGYGASIVQGINSYGGKEGKYELAVIKGTAEKWDICYNTPLTDDVIGFLTPRGVNNILKKIEELK